MNRVYFPELQSSDTIVTLTNPVELHYFLNVLRGKVGDPVSLFNGSGLSAPAKVSGVNRRQISFHLESFERHAAFRPSIMLACAVPKRSKFEWILEKSCELGVDAIVPLQTERTEVRIAPSKWSVKKERYQSVLINAVRQSRQARIPHIHDPSDLKTTVEFYSPGRLCLMPSLQGKPISLRDSLDEAKKAASLLILIGPEGDFTPDEYEWAHHFGCRALSLGPTILKVETAAFATLSFYHLFLRA